MENSKVDFMMYNGKYIQQSVSQILLHLSLQKKEYYLGIKFLLANEMFVHLFRWRILPVSIIGSSSWLFKSFTWTKE
jgi:hypothetical protein